MRATWFQSVWPCCISSDEVVAGRWPSRNTSTERGAEQTSDGDLAALRSLSLAGFHIFDPAGALKLVPYFHVADRTHLDESRRRCGCVAPLSFPAGAASGKLRLPRIRIVWRRIGPWRRRGGAGGCCSGSCGAQRTASRRLRSRSSKRYVHMPPLFFARCRPACPP